MERVIVSPTENSVSSAHAQTVGTRLSFLSHTINSVHVGMRLVVVRGGEEEVIERTHSSTVIDMYVSTTKVFVSCRMVL